MLSRQFSTFCPGSCSVLCAMSGVRSRTLCSARCLVLFPGSCVLSCVLDLGPVLVFCVTGPMPLVSYTLPYVSIHVFCSKTTHVSCSLSNSAVPKEVSSLDHGWRNRGDREGPSPPVPINSISWVGPGRDPIYNKMGPFYFSWAIAIVV